MTTTVNSTIGTGGTYSTPQLWEDDCPDLVAQDKIWRGSTKNQEFSSTGTILTISGNNVDSGHYLELTTDTGASWADNASVRSNAYRYNASNGAAFKTTSYYSPTVIVEQNYTRINKLQIAQTRNGTGSRCALQCGVTAAGSCDFNQLICESYNTQDPAGSMAGTVTMYGAGNRIRNSLILQLSASGGAIAWIGNGSDVYNCAFAAIGGTIAVGIRGSYGSTTLKNVVVCGATSPTTGSTTFNKTNCYTDASGPPSGWSAIAFSTATFENITVGSHDFRPKSGSALIDAGAAEATYSSHDATGLARPQGGATDVGPWEWTSSGTNAPGGSATVTSSASGGAASVGGTNAPGGSATVTSSTSGGAASGGAGATFTLPERLWGSNGESTAGLAVKWSWLSGARIGSINGKTVVDGIGTLHGTTGLMSMPGLPAGVGIMLVAKQGASYASDDCWLIPGTAV